jgi:AcrR family transcriptional regulator
VAVITAPAPRLDRRHRRRQETIEQALDVAIAVMSEQGAAGLSLGEVARRMGIRPPSLYVYYESKTAVYDAVFARGWREVREAMEAQYGRLQTATDLPAFLLECARVFVRWAIEHPARSQLMFWRPVPNYQPSAGAFAPAIEMLAQSRAVLVRLRDSGLFRADIGVDDALSAWTVLLSGVITQQLANAPEEPFATGRFTSRLPELVAMYLAHYQSPQRKTPTRRSRHGGTGRPDR